jgi:hypothetical protein
MKKFILNTLGAMAVFIVLTMVIPIQLAAQDVTTIEAKNTDISDNLDLEAVVSLFSDATDLEDFENRLNDPETHISNLDLNEDGFVDYLRVVENAKGDAHAITIQAVIGIDLYQDVATIDVEREDDHTTRVQVVGNVYMYGPNYIIEPIFLRPPVIFLWFWGPRYVIWHSPYYWDYYPSYFHYWRPYAAHVYLQYIPTHVYTHHTYHYVNRRRSIRCKALHEDVKRRDYELKRPDQSFEHRNVAVQNKKQLKDERAKISVPSTKPADRFQTTDKKVKKDFKPQSKKESRTDVVNKNKVIVPQTKKDAEPIKKNPTVVKETKRPTNLNGSSPATKKTTRKVNPAKKKPPITTKPQKQEPSSVKSPKVKAEKVKTPRTTTKNTKKEKGQ